MLPFVNDVLVVTATHKPKVKIMRNAVVRFPWAARTGAEVGVVVAGEDASTLELVATAANDVLIGMVIRGMGDSHVMLDTAIRTA
jgi:hypothetical protein